MSTAAEWSVSERLDDSEAATVSGNVHEIDGDAVRAYLVQIGRVPLLTAPEELRWRKTSLSATSSPTSAHHLLMRA